MQFWPFLLASTLAFAFIHFCSSKRYKAFYPPGPKPRPLVGNLFDIPVKKPWKVYRHWVKLYGDLMHLETLGQHIVVVNSRKLADRMFEKRSRIYSDRPLVPMIELMGWTSVSTAFMLYSQEWRVHRRVYQQVFRPTVIPDYHTIISSKVDQLLSNLRESPDSFATHTRNFAAAAILGTVYGYDVPPTGNDDLVNLVEKVVASASAVGQPSGAVVNVLPFLRHLPLEFPIFSFQRIAQEARKDVDEMRRIPYEFVKNNMATGSGKFSLLAKLLDNHAANGGGEHHEDLIRDALTTAYIAMAIHPEIQRRAQRDIDAVLGKGQVVTYADRADLPYVEAILRETLRWAPVVPLGIFHAAFIDDIFDDYFIPKGKSPFRTIVISNIWAMTRDENDYPEPESFIPERFLTKNGTCNDNLMQLPFGFGRRKCAGRHFALSTLWMAMTSILSQFDVGQPENEEGRPIKGLADVNYSDVIFNP
ncbi:cytochrome P450 [Marasmius fiardii PR-910]|nr:cytochrome P450 [Marasmius fiardii PR-910]